MKDVRLSIVVATYNRLAELRRMLDTLLPQVRREPVEVLIVDDASTDGTWEWLQGELRGDRQIPTIRLKRNSGLGPARNAALEKARGEYFLPIDSDFLLIEGAIAFLLQTLSNESGYELLFFPCLISPGMHRTDKLRDRVEITYSSLFSEQVGELIPVANLAYMRAQNLSYPALRAGGESVLWAKLLRGGARGLFIDTPIVIYRTDVGQRICTLEYQMSNPGALAEVSDAVREMLGDDSQSFVRRLRAQKSLAAGTYYLLAGQMGIGRRRLLSAAAEGCWIAIPALITSFGGHRLFEILFRTYRTKISKAYLSTGGG